MQRMWRHQYISRLVVSALIAILVILSQFSVIKADEQSFQTFSLTGFTICEKVVVTYAPTNGPIFGPPQHAWSVNHKFKIDLRAAVWYDVYVQGNRVLSIMIWSDTTYFQQLGKQPCPEITYLPVIARPQ